MGLEEMSMNKTLLSAGIVVIVGVVIMAIGQAMYVGASNSYWDAAAYGTVEEWLDEGKRSDLYMMVSDVGLMIVGVGVAILAFGLAATEPKPATFRPVETQIPLTQYPPQPPRQ